MSQKLAIKGLATKLHYALRQVGAHNTTGFQLFLESNGQPLSFFHDVPLEEPITERKANHKNRRVFNMVVEIPRWTNGKCEIATKLPFNPIIMDAQNGQPRFVKNVFPYNGYIWNYGALPQTWEDPAHVDLDTQHKGDNDPVDVIEIGQSVGFPGQIKQVKILGTLALLDQGETDWKMLAIDLEDPNAAYVDDIADVEVHFPGLISATVDWFQNYKLPDGKARNEFAFGAKPRDANYALQIIDQTHTYWKNLVNSHQVTHGIATLNATLESSPFYDPNFVLPPPNPLPAAPIPDSLQKWHFCGKPRL